MKPKIFHCRTRKGGPTTPVTVRLTKYQSNNRLAVQLICAKAPWSPFATITVNLPDVPEELLKMWFGSQTPDKNMLAFLDTNNHPTIEKWIQDHGFGLPMGYSERSGFCQYPLYTIFVNAL
jgi:hypothetical protein